jgi:hypothetical protein
LFLLFFFGAITKGQCFQTWIWFRSRLPSLSENISKVTQNVIDIHVLKPATTSSIAHPALLECSCSKLIILTTQRQTKKCISKFFLPALSLSRLRAPQKLQKPPQTFLWRWGLCLCQGDISKPAFERPF